MSDFLRPYGAHQAPLVHGIFQARILEWVAISNSRVSSWPRDQTQVSSIFCTGRWILYHWVSPNSLFSIHPFLSWNAHHFSSISFPLLCLDFSQFQYHDTFSSMSSLLQLNSFWVITLKAAWNSDEFKSWKVWFCNKSGIRVYLNPHIDKWASKGYEKYMKDIFQIQQNLSLTFFL